MTRRQWTAAECESLRALYADYGAAECAFVLGRTARQVYNKANAMGLRKSPEWIAERARLHSLYPLHPARQHRFQPGHATWNKGMKGLQIGGESTRFVPGNRPHTWQPVEHEVVRDGQLWRKVTDEHRGAESRRNFRPVSVLVWEAAHGPVPAGHVVRFRDGLATTVAAEITIERLELITRAENMARNSYHRYPKEVAALIQLRGALNRKINARTKGP